MDGRTWASAIFGLLVAVPGCNQIDFDDLFGDDPPPPAWAEKTEFEPAPSGSLFADHTVLAFDILYAPTPRRPPEQELDRLLAEADQPFTKVGEVPEGGQRPTVAAALVDREPLWKDKPERFDRHAHGIGKAKSKAFRAPGKQLQLRFGLPGRNPLQLHRRAMEITERIANRTGGAIWDPVIREVFSARRWAERLAKWSGDFPPLSHYLKSDWFFGGGLVRNVTAGMSEFGLPDLQIDRVPEHPSAWR